MKRFLYLALFAMNCLLLKANTDSTLRFCNAIYEGDIRTVRVIQENSGFNFPVIALQDALKTLRLEFDQITSERDYYQFTLIHCDAQWNRSNLVKTQFLDGTGFENIENNVFSNSTLTQYVHYSINFPTEQTMPKISGNYLLVVYRNFNEADIVLSRRLMVLNSKGNVEMTVSQSSQVEFRAENQQVNFTFTTLKDYFIPNPYQDLTAVILRNGEWLTANNELRPQFIQNQSYAYKQMIGSQFQGINEYRYFDIRSLRASQAWVKKKMNIGNQKHVWLVADNSRGYDRYMNWNDYNGRVFYDNKDILKDSLLKPNGFENESDYCFVHFSLSMDLIDKDIYVYGELSDWRIQESHKLYYNVDAKIYETVIPLKQGYYNYIYGVADKESKSLDFKILEGSHSATENNYMVLMYHQNQTMPYDELIGYGLKNSQGKN